MNLSALFIKRPIGTILFAIGIAIIGMAAFRALPVASLPQVDFATITVTSMLPGASPEVMASSVATPLERQFGHIAGVSQMTSQSTLGVSLITLQFDLSRNVDGAARDVQAAINAARTYLPQNLPSNPSYKKVNSAAMPVLILYLTSDVRDPATIYNTASSVVEQRLSQIDGVANVSVGGSSLPAVRVDLNTQQLNGYGLGVQDVAHAIALQNSNRPKGQLADDKTSYDITANDQLTKAADYAPIIVGKSTNATVRLRDVANVYDSMQTLRSVGLANGKRAVLLVVYRLPDANAVETEQRIMKALPFIRASIPPDEKLEVATDFTTTIRASVTDVERTLILSTLLVVFVVFVFLRAPRSTLIPGVAVTLSIVGTFGVMYLSGFTLDNLSLMALTISTGFVVDDAIVVMENITRHIEMGTTPMEAALTGTREVAFTVLSMSLSLIAVFVPILFMGGVVGRLFHEFAFTLASAIAVSMVISLTVTPMMCAYLLKSDKNRKHNALYRVSEKSFELLQTGYRSSLNWTLRHPALIMAMFAFTFVYSGYLATKVKKGFFPVQDTGALMGSFLGPQDSSFTKMSDSLYKIEAVIRSDPAVQFVVGTAGGQGGTSGGGSNSGILFIGLKPLEERKVSGSQVVDRLRSKLHSITGASTYLQAVQELSVGARQSNGLYQYQISADTVNALSVWGPKLLDEMRTLPSITDVSTDQQNHGLEMLLDYDRATAARLGITPQMVNDTLYYQFGEAQISTIYGPLNQYYVVINASPQQASNPTGLQSTYLHSSAKRVVPLAAISHFMTGTAPLAVNHSSFFPSVTISFNLAKGAALSDVTRDIDRLQKRIGMPATIRGQFAGTADAFTKSLSSEPVLLLLAIIAIYIVLGVLYESLIHPITILTTLPSAGVGALFALVWFGSELDVVSFIGLFLLLGIVMKNAIMMIDFALQAERNEGKNPADSIFEAAMLRFRPIMMTTIAAMLGAFPLAFGRGTGSELRRPLGIAIVGGLLFSQILTLYTTPVIYLYFDRLAQKIKRTKSHSILQKQTSEGQA